MPPTIAALVKAKNDRDTNAVVACFADDAVVHDEGQEMRGLAAIKEWSDKGFQRYRYSGGKPVDRSHQAFAVGLSSRLKSQHQVRFLWYQTRTFARLFA